VANVLFGTIYFDFSSEVHKKANKDTEPAIGKFRIA
jgi:hypothetical protein